MLHILEEPLLPKPHYSLFLSAGPKIASEFFMDPSLGPAATGAGPRALPAE